MNHYIAEQFKIAYFEASLSVDPNTQCGVVLVPRKGKFLTANNHPVFGNSINDDRFMDRKKRVMEHAERAVIYKAAKLGIATEGATLYAPWSACTDCARAIVEAGIKTVHRHTDAMELTHDHWKKTTEAGYVTMIVGGVNVIDHEGYVGASKIRIDKKVFKP
jgi:deoxycytidylate deaminase